MSWTDLESLRTINRLREEFNIEVFVETGAYKGTNAYVQSSIFKRVLTCEIVDEYIKIAKEKLKDKKNVKIYKKDSPKFLKYILKKTRDYIFVYLDAHFYNPELPKKDRFVVLKELKALKDCKNCIIAIHDFDNGEFGHITYDKQSLNFGLLSKRLKNVNKDFHYYTNTECDIIKSGTEIGLNDDEEMKSTLDFVWSSPEKTKRGILYCVPKKLDLNKYKLREINGT